MKALPLVVGGAAGLAAWHGFIPGVGGGSLEILKHAADGVTTEAALREAAATMQRMRKDAIVRTAGIVVLAGLLAAFATRKR